MEREDFGFAMTSATPPTSPGRAAFTTPTRRTSRMINSPRLTLTHDAGVSASQKPFQLPLKAKAIVGLATAVALVSLGKLESAVKSFSMETFGYDYSNARGLRVPTITKYQSPRVVFLGGNPWFNADTTRIIIDNTQLLHQSNSTDHDPTRFYHFGNSEDFPDMESRLWPSHEFDPHCEPSAEWQSTFYPTCNEVHSTADMRQSLVDQDLSLLSNKGFWRHAWRHNIGAVGANSSSTTVLKTFKINHNFEEKYYEDNRVDAVAMERLTSSRYIINMYGFCGLTVVQEFAGRELAHVAGQLANSEKLVLAKKVAQGVADIHSIKGDDGKIPNQPSLVHNDLNLANLVFTPGGRPVLNDFNIAILIMKHNTTGDACPFYSHFPNPQWKAPEEQVESDKEADENPPVVNEKIDIYALGNILYRIVAGASPWKRPEAAKLYPEEKLVVARLKKYNGTQPSIPSEILGNGTEPLDPPIETLLEAMKWCYSFAPNDRPTAQELVRFFDDAIIAQTYK